MTSPTTRFGLTAALAAAFLVAAGSTARAQCNACAQPVYAAAPVAQPTVAYSPVLAPAPAPAGYQAYRPYDGWYPGKYLGRALTWPFRAIDQAVAPLTAPPVVAAPVAAPTQTFVTAAYRPTYPLNYTVGYAPAVQTVARPVTLTALSPCGCGPVCSSGCSTCASSGVTTAGFETSYTPGCSSCASQPAPASYESYETPTYSSPSNRSLQPTPAPAISPNERVPESRVQRPDFDQYNPPSYEAPAEESPNDASILQGDGSGTRGGPDADASSYWDAPQLFDARDRSAQRPRTQRPSANVWNAVYHQSASAANRSAAYRPTSYQPAPAKRNAQVGASGWQPAR
ncbi:MAG: hypothetical protein AAF589_08280 [Planctomycetota bacterium]